MKPLGYRGLVVKALEHLRINPYATCAEIGCEPTTRLKASHGDLFAAPEPKKTPDIGPVTKRALLVCSRNPTLSVKAQASLANCGQFTIVAARKMLREGKLSPYEGGKK